MIDHDLLQRRQLGIQPLRLLYDLGFIGAELHDFCFQGLGVCFFTLAMGSAKSTWLEQAVYSSKVTHF